MLASVNPHTNATSVGWHLWEIDFRFVPGLPPGWEGEGGSGFGIARHIRHPVELPATNGGRSFDSIQTPLPFSAGKVLRFQASGPAHDFFFFLQILEP